LVRNKCTQYKENEGGEENGLEEEGSANGEDGLEEDNGGGDSSGGEESDVVKGLRAS
jgi:hypothetical protein